VEVVMPYKDPEQRKECITKWRLANKERIAQQNREWSKQNPGKRAEYSARWRKKNPEKQKEYSKKQTLTFLINRKVWFKTIKETLSCIKCNENRWWCLEFHHRDPNEKEKAISWAMWHWGKKRILAEIAKCDVLCANCHRDFHYKQKQETE
jgi:hypothetical protein